MQAVAGAAKQNPTRQSRRILRGHVMADQARASAQRGPLHRHVEIGLAIAMIVFAAITIYGSYFAGLGWGAEGPRSGFFPFWIGALILVASIANLTRIFVAGTDGRIFANWHQLTQVLLVVAPMTVYVFAVPWIGIYVASVFLIGGFMRYFGRYSWFKVVLVAILVPLGLFVTFERWFLVPLPKGPIEDLLGL